MPISGPDPQGVSLSVKIYQGMLIFYPGEFRAEFGEEMVQVFQAACRRSIHEQGPAGLWRLWGRVLVDTLIATIEQYSNRGAVMTRMKWIQLSGWLLAASGLLLGAGWLAGSRPVYDPFNALSLPIDRYGNAAALPLLIAGTLCLAFGILGLLNLFGGRVGALGRAGLATSLAGAAAGLVGVTGLGAGMGSPYWEISLLGQTGMFAGLALFGIDSQRVKLFRHGNSLPLLAGLPWLVLALTWSISQAVTKTSINAPEVISAAVLVLTFLGLGLTGYLLHNEAVRTHNALAGS